MDFLTFFFVGIVAFAILQQIVIPVAVQLVDGLILWVLRRPQARLHKWRSLDPVEQNLQRASHGAVLVGLVLLAFLDIPHSVMASVRSHAPAGMWPGLLILPLAYGVVRFLVGVRRSWGILDGLLAVRALVKIVVGTALLFWMPSYLRQLIMSAVAASGFPTLRELVLEVLVPLAACWCIATGVVRFMLTVSGGFRFRRNVPRPVPMPHGESRLAGPGEGQRAMQSQGQISRMDGRKF